MSDLFLVPDIEQLLSSFLRDQDELADLVDTRVYTAIPKDPVFPLVRLTRFGGEPRRTNPLWLDAPAVQVDAFGGSKKLANQIAETCRAVLDRRLFGVYPEGVVSGCRVGALVYQPDDTYTPAKPRFLFTVTVYTHADTGGIPAFSPDDLDGLIVWLDAGQLALSDGDPVASWADSSGNLLNFAQPDPDKRPTFKTNVVNGQPVVRFDNVDDALQSPVGLPQPTTVFVVFKIDETGPWEVLSDLTPSVAVGQYLYGSALGESSVYAGAGFTVGDGVTQGDWNIFAVRFDGAASKANRGDTGTTFAGDAGTATFDGPQLIGGGTSRPTGGDIAEVLVYNGALPGADVDAIGAYLASKYGLTWTGGAS